MGKITIEVDNISGDKSEKIAIIKGLCVMLGISILHDLAEGVEPVETKKLDSSTVDVSDKSVGPETTTNTVEDTQETKETKVDYLPKIRTLIKEKAKDHRDAIQEKMAEFNAESLPRVPVENHKELYEFLKNLA